MYYKQIVLSIYLLVGLLLVFVPLASELRAATRALGDLSSRKALPAPESASSWARGYVIGLLLALLLVWWTSIPAKIFSPSFYLYLICIAACGLAFFHEMRAGKADRATRRATTVFLAVAASVVVPLSFSTGFLDTQPQKLWAWHHWSAYIGPSELLLSGARIFFDFPTQYGLGPTALVALACGENCWIGMYFVVGVTATLFAILGFALVADLRPRTAPAAVVVLAACMAAFMFWTAYPRVVSTTLTTPSVSGLRFLPVLALVAVLVWSEKQSFLRRRWIAFGTFAFSAAALWSPESLFISALIWGPYFLLRRLADADAKKMFSRLFAGLAYLAATVVVIYGVALIAYRSYAGVWPDADAFFAYILYPPGPMPINPKGPVLFFVAALAIGAMNCWYAYRSKGNTDEFRRSMAFLLLAYGTFAYVLGRGHDNNFCNIMPYGVLVLCDAVLRPMPLAVRGAAAGMLASAIGLMAFFGWGAWYGALSRGALLSFEPRKAIATWSYDFPGVDEQIREQCRTVDCKPEDAVRGLRQLRPISSDPVMVLSDDHLSLPASSSQPWSAMHAPLNYEFLPADIRRRFLRRTMERFQRGGWMLFEKTLDPFWYEDFRSAYRVLEERDFGTYRAVHFAPNRP
jgi:hypothetical protein